MKIKSLRLKNFMIPTDRRSYSFFKEADVKNEAFRNRFAPEKENFEQSLPKSELAKTKWFKEQIEAIITKKG